MTQTTAQTASQADLDLARGLTRLLPRFGKLWGAAVRASGASGPRLKVLGMLGAHGPARAGEIAMACGSSPSAVSELIDPLVDDGLLQREHDANDRRVVVVGLTAQGRAELERAQREMTQAMLELLARLTPAQRATLAEALPVLNELVGDQSAQHKETTHAG